MRVQVNPLADPERLRPPAPATVVFRQPAQAPVDNNMAALADGLGAFNRGLQEALSGTDSERKKAEQKAFETKVAAIAADADPAKRVDGYQRFLSTGDFRDTIQKEAVEKTLAAELVEAEMLAISKDIQAGSVPIGEDGFVPADYVNSRFAALKERYKLSPGALKAVAVGTQRAYDTLSKVHDETIFKRQDQELVRVAGVSLANTVDQAVAKGLDAAGVMEAVKEAYKAIGPRKHGGSLDIGYDRLDKVFLGILAERVAADPKTARIALDLLGSGRTGVNGEKLPALGEIAGAGELIDSVRKKAAVTLGREFEADIKGKVAAEQASAFRRADGTALLATDINVVNPYTGAEIKITAEQQRKQAAEAFLMEVRARTQGRGDFEEEFRGFARNNTKHPEWFTFIDASVRAADPNMVSTPEGLQRVRLAGDIYKRLSDRNRAYLEAHANKETVEFFDTLDVLVNVKNVPLQAAISEVLNARQEISTKEGSEMYGRRRDEVVSKVKSMDFNGWFPGGGANNQMLLQNQVIRLADALVKTRQITPEEAIEAASESVKKSALLVNGRAVFAPGLGSEDVPYIISSLGQIFEGNKDFLTEEGIDGPDGLSVVRTGQGLQVIDAATGVPLMLPRLGADGEITMGIPTITNADVSTARNAAERASAEAEREAARLEAVREFTRRKVMESNGQKDLSDILVDGLKDAKGALDNGDTAVAPGMDDPVTQLFLGAGKAAAPTKPAEKTPFPFFDGEPGIMAP